LCINNVIKESGKPSLFEIKLTTTWLTIGGSGEEGSTLSKHQARLNTQQVDVYCKETKIHGMKPVAQVTQSITDERDKMIKQELMDDLYLNKIDTNVDIWQINYKRLKQT
jgi:hypothetical protein